MEGRRFSLTRRSGADQRRVLIPPTMKTTMAAMKSRPAITKLTVATSGRRAPNAASTTARTARRAAFW